MQILGSKKGSKQPQKPHIAKDDLNSTSFYKGLYGLCEGEILGLADGGKSIKLDGTPLINANGQPNFKGVTWDFRAGTLDQSHISGFPAVENEQNIGVELRHDRPYTKAIINKELSAVRVRLNLNALREQKDNGDITGYAIEYAIDLQIDTGAFAEVLRQVIRGKASNGFKRSHRIDLPPAKKGWTIRIRRITPNRDSDLVADTMTVDAITEIIDAKLAYPCTALLGLSYDAKTFNNIAKLSVRLKGKIIQVPTNYNPDTRQYTGLWDGTFKLAYSNNPAWVFYDLCTHKRYGLGERLNGMVDKWRLYQIGQYCDELVDDGKGGKEPRFTVNVYIQKAEDAYKVLQNLASVFRGMSFWDGSNIVVDSDTPKDPVYTFSPANVVGGEFNYTGTRAKDRHSVVRVAWDNPDNDFKTEYEFVKDENAIATQGLRMLDINAFGCTSQGQAQRAGLWALKSEQLETRSVTFKTGLQGFIPQVGQVINIADDIFAGRAISGRIVGVNDNQISLDRTAGKVGDTLTIATADGVLSSTITAINDKVVTVNQALNVANDSIWAIVSHDLNLMQFRILSIAQNDDATFDITALQYEPQKFEAVDNGVHITPQPYSVLKATPITAPNSVSLTSSTRTVQGQALTTLTINWEQVTGAVAYIVKWRKDDGNWQTLPRVSGQSVDIDGIYAGKYLAQVQAVDSFDNESLPTTSQLTQITGKTGKPPRLAKLVVKGILFGMQIDWTFAKGGDDTNFTQIEVSPDGRSNITTLGTFAYPTNKYEITGLQGGLTQFYRARIVDKLGNTSDWTAWTKGVTDSRADKVLDLLNGQITQSQLHNDLSAPIAKIGTIESNINAIGGKIPRIESTIGKIGGIENTLNTRLPSIQTDIGRLTNNIGTINTQIRVSEQQLNTAKQAIATAQNTLNTAVNNITTERNRINNAIRDINALQSANNAKTQEITNLTNTVGGHTSSIRELGVTTGNLSQKYSQLKTASDTANSQITAIKQTQNGQATSIERLGSRFDNLAVGGRNLLLNTQTLNPLWTIPTSIENGIATFVGTGRLLATIQRSDNIQALENGKVTISFTAKSNQDGRLHIRLRRFNTNNQLSDIAQYIAIDSREFKRYSLTLNYEKWKNQDRVNFEIATYEQAGFVCEVKLPKLEIGTIPTDWTPAPEDLQTDIDSKATTANLDNLRQTLTNADTALSQQITAMDTAYKSADRQLTANLASEITARTSADTALGQRIDTLTADYNGNKASLANQVKALVDKDTATAGQISQITANVSTAQNTANNANSKADTATSKADNAQSTANNALNRANTANSAITTEQRARADADTALSQRITALDTAYKSADNNLTSRLAREETARASGDNANAQALRTLESTVNGIGGRIGTSEGKIATLERTTSDLNGAIATTQSQMNARFDNLKIGGRNLILGSQISRTTHGTTNLTISQNIDFGNVTHLVLSCDVRFANAVRATTQGAKWFRIGAEIRLVWTDGTSGWYGAWRSNVTNGTSFDGRVEHKIATPTGKTLRAIDSVKIQIWDITGENMLVKNPKLELGTIATDWTPAPEDVNVDLSPYATNASINEFKQTQANKDSATTQKLSQLESGLNGKANANALNSLTTKVNQVDGQIRAQVSKVNTLQTTVNNQTASISQHSQTLNGLSAQYTIKVQTGGVVAGIGLASNNGVSDFAVRADKFYIASPQGQKGDTPFTVLTSPQVINGVQVPAGTYIKNAFIANGSITMAKIADSIQSDNYVQGRSGWRLYKNGELEINSSFGDGTRIQLNSRGLTGWYANGQKAFELGIFN